MTTNSKTMLQQISIEAILESPYQGRMLLFENENDNYTREQLESLAEDIRANGLLNPVILRPKRNKYELIDGHRRVLACKILGHKKVEAIIKEFDDRHAQVSSITANLQRKNLSNIELAIAYKKILHTGLFKDKKELSAAIGKDETFIGDLLNTLNMDSRIVEDLKINKSINDVRMLRAIRRYDKTNNEEISDKQWELYQRILTENLSRQDVLNMVRERKRPGGNDISVAFWGNKVQLELPNKLSKDQKKVFSNLIHEKIKEILEIINA